MSPLAIPSKKVGWKVYGSFVLVLGILCYLSFLSYQNTKVLVFDTRSVDTTSELLYETQTLTSILRDTETMNNIYILIGKQKFLDHYSQKVHLLLAQLQKMKSLRLGNEYLDLEKLIQMKID